MEISAELTRKSETALSALLHHLDAIQDAQSQSWRDWKIQPIAGGANNRLFRVVGPLGDLVVKFTIRDERDRAGREFAALQALHQAGLVLAPRAIWLDRHSFSQPVVVQTWLEGEALTSPPQTLQDWQALADHYCAIHQLTSEKTAVRISPAVLYAASGTDGKALVRRHLERIPTQYQPESLQRLIKRFKAWEPLQWPPPKPALCRVDANWRNFIRRPSTWGSVDWENSGWGDPAFEIADLITHPAYLETMRSTWEWLISYYSEQMGDDNAPVRIQTYKTIMLVWWVVRWQRYLYEVPRGLDSRLMDRPAAWLESIEQNYQLYLNLAEASLP
jgi:aminoglycoside phosphotransferase (APT) family kinase protein